MEPEKQPDKPAATPAPIVPTVVDKPAAVELPADMKELIANPEAFKARLAKEREHGTKAMLKEFGFDNLDGAKAFLAEAKKEAEAKKTEAQRVAEKIAALEPLAKRAEAQDKTFRDLLAVEEAAIPEAMKHLLDLAPTAEQSEARLLWLTKARAKGMFVAPAAPAPAAEEKKPPANSRAGNNAPPPPAPPPGAKHPRDMTTDEFKTYERQKLAEHTAR